MIIERTRYVPNPGKLAEVLATRHRACDVRVSLGLPAGNVFTEETDQGTLVHWSCRFASEEEHQKDLASRAASPDFEAVREQMRGLISHFERRFLKSAPRPGAAVQERCLRGIPLVPREQIFESHGLRLKGYLYLPPGEGPFPCLVFNHGSTINQGTDDVCRPGTAHPLLGWNLAVFMPHRRGYGNSPGMPWKEEVNAAHGTPDYDRRLVMRLDGEADDVVAAFHHLLTVPEIRTDRIGVMGSSFGGVMTLLSAAREPRFRCAVEFAGAAMNWEVAPRLREYLLGETARLTQPIFFAQAENDFSIRPTLELADAAKKAGKVVHHRIYPAFGLTAMEGHLLCGQGGQVWEEDVRWFLERYL
jgi:carboxymethylenebutenolidase